MVGVGLLRRGVRDQVKAIRRMLIRQTMNILKLCWRLWETSIMLEWVRWMEAMGFVMRMRVAQVMVLIDRIVRVRCDFEAL